MDFARRDLLAASAAATAYALLPGRAFAADSAADARASKLLDGITEQMLRDFPESATGLGIDKGARAALKSQRTCSRSSAVREADRPEAAAADASRACRFPRESTTLRQDRRGPSPCCGSAGPPPQWRQRSRSR